MRLIKGEVAKRRRARSRRTKTSVTSIRSMVRPARYAEFEFMVQLKPVSRWDFEIIDRKPLLDTIRAAGLSRFKIVKTKGYADTFIRIYVFNMAAVLAIKMIAGDEVWKIYRLVDKK